MSCNACPSGQWVPAYTGMGLPGVPGTCSTCPLGWTCNSNWDYGAAVMVVSLTDGYVGAFLPTSTTTDSSSLAPKGNLL